MLICKIFLQNFIHEVTTIIIFDCHDNYSDIQQHVQSGKCSKTQNAREAREIAFAAIFILQIICWMFHLKEKQTTFCIIRRRITKEKGVRANGILRQSAGMRQARHFFPRMFTNPGPLLTNVAVYDKPNLTRHFQVVRHFGRRHSTIDCLYKRTT